MFTKAMEDVDEEFVSFLSFLLGFDMKNLGPYQVDQTMGFTFGRKLL